MKKIAMTKPKQAEPSDATKRLMQAKTELEERLRIERGRDRQRASS